MTTLCINELCSIWRYPIFEKSKFGMEPSPKHLMEYKLHHYLYSISPKIKPRKKKAELERGQTESRSRAKMDYSQVGLPRFLDQNDISHPLNRRMTKLEATMAELEILCVECATSQVQLMEVIRANVQIQPTPF